MSFLQSKFKTFAHVPRQTVFEKTISSISEPDLVVIPLEYPGQVLYKPQVKEGDEVCQNQIIGRSELGNCVHASVSGVIKEIKPIWTARSFNVPAMVIEPNGKEPLPVEEMFKQYGVEYQSASRVERMKACGTVTPWTLPGKFHHEEDLEKFPKVKHIVIKGVNEEPTVFIFELLLQQKVEKVIRGMKQLDNIAPGAQIWLTVPAYLVKWARERFGNAVKVVGLSDEYKGRIERLVVPRLTGIDIPNMTPYRAKGLAVLSVEYLLRMVDALDGESPFIYKYITVSGSDIDKSLTVKVPLGTPINVVLKYLGLQDRNYSRVLVGGPMKGIAQFTEDTPLTKSSHGLYLMMSDSLPQETNFTCINCGCCTRVCPVKLQVHLISRYVEYDMLDDARAYHPEACNECGLCAYVCPAHRPLVQLIRVCNQYGK